MTLSTAFHPPPSVETEAAVSLTDVRFAWAGERRFGMTVDRFVVERGERLLIVGPSGSGKSTLLALMCGVVTPSAGRVTTLGTDLGSLSGAGRDRFRGAHFGIVFQMFNLVPYLSVLDNILLPLRFAPDRRAQAGGAAAADQAHRLLARLGLDAKALAGQAASRLSVGEQQRVAVARALIGAPEIVLADEPTSALDRDRQRAFLDLLFAEVAEAKATLVMVSHDIGLAGLFDRVVELGSLARFEHAGAAP